MSENQLTKRDVEEKIKDWTVRISRLYGLIARWLDAYPAYSIKDQSETKMYEEMMEKYQVPPISLKLLDVYHENHIVATVKPVGLWIVGTNGRLDILYKDGAVILVDESEQFQKSEWIAYSRKNKNNGILFNEEYFLELLEIC